MQKPRLYILPHAGGASYAYTPLANALNADFEVHCLDLPGHGRRTREKTLNDMAELARDCLSNISPDPDRPWAIFGHSMGGLLAHAICYECEQKNHPLPGRLFVSGTSSPRSKQITNISHLPTQPFWDAVSQYGGIPDEILNSPDLKDYFEDILRDDFKAIEGYTDKTNPLTIPITVFYGLEDMGSEKAASWRAETSSNCAIHPFSGGHFFLFDEITAISRYCKQYLL